EPVHVGADLRRRRHLLHHPADPVAADPALRRPQPLAELPAGEGGDGRVEDVGEVEHSPGADQPGGPHHSFGGDLVEGAGLVAGAVAGWIPALAHSEDQVPRKSAKSVSPPSTKIVWPVT